MTPKHAVNLYTTEGSGSSLAKSWLSYNTRHTMVKEHTTKTTESGLIFNLKNYLPILFLVYILLKCPNELKC